MAVVFRLIVSLLTGVIIAFVSSPELAAILLIALILGTPGSYIENKFYFTNSVDLKSQQGSPNLVLTDILMNIRQLHSNAMSKSAFSALNQSIVTHSRGKTRNDILIGVAWGYSRGINLGINAYALYFGGYYVEYKGLDPLKMMQAVLSILFVVMGLSEGLLQFTSLNQAKASLTRLFLNMYRNSLADCRDESGYKGDFNGEVKAQNLHFEYPTRADARVLNGATLTVDENQTAALVGASGCGKSTVMLLLERFYDISKSKNPSSALKHSGSLDANSLTESKLLIDGRSIYDYNLSHLRSSIAYVSQEPILFNETIKENIRYGRMDATDEEVYEAAKFANADEFILSQPGGYDTNVGYLGEKLSGGQKQRIAIARSILRNPKILLLDEATSALDSESEALIQASIDKYLQEKSPCALVIAHRLPTIQNSDIIYVFANPQQRGGRVMESGTHKELQHMPYGIYASLLQASV